MRVKALTVVAEVNPNVAKAKKVWNQDADNSDEYAKFGFSGPLEDIWINDGTEQRTVVAEVTYQFGMNHSPRLWKKSEVLGVWDWDTGERLYMRNIKGRPWSESLYSTPEGEGRQSQEADIKKSLLKAADDAENAGNPTTAEVLRWLAQDPRRFVTIKKVLDKRK